MMVMLVFSQIGYYFVMHMAQHERKEFIKELLHKNINDDILTVIDFTTNKQKIYWEEEGKEFFFNGDMYDLIKTKNVQGKIFFYCINDEKEKELINNYNTVTKNNSSTDKKTKNTFENSFSPYLLINFCIFFPLKSLNNKYFFTTINIETGNTRADLKPPQALFI